VDLAGDDVWTATGGGAQAAAQYQCVALLLDSGGNDRYTAPRQAQAWAEDRAVAMLSDAAGDDRYDVGRSGQGHGGWGSVALLWDGAGRDTYVSTGGRGGGGIAIGVRLDADGEASYLDASPPRGPGGLGYSTIPVPSSDEEVASMIEEHASSPSAAASALVSAGPARIGAALKRVSRARPAEIEVVHRYIARGAGARTPQEQRAVAQAITADAMSREQSADDATVKWHLVWLAALAGYHPEAVEDALKAAVALRDHPNGLVRSKALGIYRAVAQNPQLTVAVEDLAEWESHGAVALQKDSTAEVRWAAVDLLEVVGGPGVASIVGGSLKTGDAAMRGRAEAALVAIAARTDGVAVARAVFPLIDDGPLPVRAAALRVIGTTGHREAWEVLEPALAAGDPRIRRAAIRGCQPLLPSREIEAALLARAEVEEEPRVRTLLPEVRE
jgi:HEAT repeat protein